MKSVYEQLGQRIRARREEQGISQTKLSASVKLTRTSISNIENGRQHLPLHTLYRFARALGCRPHDLLPEMQPEGVENSVEEQLVSAVGREDAKRFLLRMRSSSR